MENLIEHIAPKLVENYKITDAYFINGEFFITSHWELSHELANDIEEDLRTKGLDSRGFYIKTK